MRDEQSRLACSRAENVLEYTGSGLDSCTGKMHIRMQHLRTVFVVKCRKKITNVRLTIWPCKILFAYLLIYRRIDPTTMR